MGGNIVFLVFGCKISFPVLYHACSSTVCTYQPSSMIILTKFEEGMLALSGGVERKSVNVRETLVDQSQRQIFMGKWRGSSPPVPYCPIAKTNIDGREGVQSLVPYFPIAKTNFDGKEGRRHVGYEEYTRIGG